MLGDRLQVDKVEVEVGGYSSAESPQFKEVFRMRRDEDGREMPAVEREIVHAGILFIPLPFILDRPQAFEFDVDVMKMSAIQQRPTAIYLVEERLTVEIEGVNAASGKHPPKE